MNDMRTICILLASMLPISGCGSAGDGGGSSALPGLSVVIEGSTAPYPHDDGLAGQTARSVTAGIRSLTLLAEPGGTDFVLLERDGSSTVIVGYDHGVKTMLPQIDAQAIQPGRYTRARLVQDWSRFEIDATLHDAGEPIAGKLRAFHVTSDGSVVDGLALASGHYEHQFVAPGSDRSFSGSDAELPEYTTTAEAAARVEGGLWAVYFPIDVQVISADAELSILVNMNEAFRWQDFPGVGNQPGVYDFLPPLYEQVVQFGGNRFDVSYTPL
jgi:hypothetical protein